VLIALIYLDSFFDSGLLDRFTGTKEAIETGSSSASRLDIWKYSLDQFIDYPLFGDKLNTNIVNFYPHNIFLEALQSIGFFGFIPFLVLLIYALRYSMYIFKKKPQYAWLTIFFLQALMQNMFSGALYTAAWFWTGMALVLSLYSSIKKEEIKGRIT
jgi:O-antigen ligase